MKRFGIHEAKTHLSRLADGAAGRQVFIIVKSGRPMVRVVPFDAPDEPAQQRIGFLAAAIEVPDDCDSIGAVDIADSFRGAMDRLLLDTHVVPFDTMDSPRRPERARDLSSDPESELWCCAVSTWR